MSTGKTLTTHRANDDIFTFKFSDDDGVDIDITDYILDFTILNLRTREVVLHKRVENHDIPTEGETHVSITKTESNITPDTYLYDAQLITATGDVDTVVTGLFVIEERFTSEIS
jgi:hypothetical protein